MEISGSILDSLADRTIKVWDLARGKLKLSLTGHTSSVHGVMVRMRSP